MRRYGPGAPRWHQRIWVAPASIEQVVREIEPRRDSGRGLYGDWDLNAYPLEDNTIVQFGLRHWGDGVPWEDTGAYAHLEQRIATSGRRLEGCWTMDDIVERYRRLDEAFERVRAERRIRSGRWRGEFRERDGVLVSVGRAGPLFSARGCHRLAMALVLGLRLIPAEVGLVHEATMSDWRRLLRCAQGVRAA